MRYEGSQLVLGDALHDTEPQEIAHAFAALNIVMLVLLARLLGKEIARRLAEGIQDADFLEGSKPGAF
jgi:hypothetical protein